ncbi:MAG: hypothetical protein R2710_09185 [Acidimicrobiales bacterium]
MTKSTPMGSIDTPFNPLSLAAGAGATFIARTHDLDRKHDRHVPPGARTPWRVDHRDLPELQRLQRWRAR